MAITLAYLWPLLGSAPVNPNIFGKVIATVAAGAAADTSALITHAFALPNADISQGFPVVTLTPLDSNSITSPWFVASQNPNYTVLQKNTVDTTGTVQVTIDRHTVAR